jgi:hypothetical protein
MRKLRDIILNVYCGGDETKYRKVVSKDAHIDLGTENSWQSDGLEIVLYGMLMPHMVPDSRGYQNISNCYTQEFFRVAEDDIEVYVVWKVDSSG